jgi:hypothetical protein
VSSYFRETISTLITPLDRRKASQRVDQIYPDRVMERLGLATVIKFETRFVIPLSTRDFNGQGLP